MTTLGGANISSLRGCNEIVYSIIFLPISRVILLMAELCCPIALNDNLLLRTFALLYHSFVDVYIFTVFQFFCMVFICFANPLLVCRGN